MPHPISIRFPAMLRERVEARAQAERMTFSGTVRSLVEDSLAAREAALPATEEEVLRLIAETFGDRR